MRILRRAGGRVRCDVSPRQPVSAQTDSAQRRCSQCILAAHRVGCFFRCPGRTLTCPACQQAFPCAGKSAFEAHTRSACTRGLSAFWLAVCLCCCFWACFAAFCLCALRLACRSANLLIQALTFVLFLCAVPCPQRDCRELGTAAEMDAHQALHDKQVISQSPVVSTPSLPCSLIDLTCGVADADRDVVVGWIEQEKLARMLSQLKRSVRDVR